MVLSYFILLILHNMHFCRRDVKIEPSWVEEKKIIILEIFVMTHILQSQHVFIGLQYSPVKYANCTAHGICITRRDLGEDITTSKLYMTQGPTL